MVEKYVRFICGCSAHITCPADADWHDCMEHGELDVEYYLHVEKENQILREEICRANLTYALTSSDSKTRLIAEQIAKSQT